MFRRISLWGFTVLFVFSVISTAMCAGEKEKSELEGEAENVVELEFMTCDEPTTPNAAAWLEVADLYMKEHPNVKLKKTFVAYKDFFTQLSVRAMAGKPPAIAQAGYHTPEFVEAGVLVEMGPYIEKAGWKEEDFWPGIWDLTVYKGKQWGVPYTLDTRVLFYNKDMFRKAGLKPPVTWDDFIKAAPKIKETSNAYVFGMNGTDSAHYAWTFTPWIFSNKGNWIVQNANGLWQSNVTSPEVIEALNFGRDMVTNEVTVPSWPNNDIYISRELFIQEKVASIISGSWEYVFFDEAKETGNLNFEVGQILIPREKVHASTSGGWSWYVFKSDEWDPQVCWDVINFFLQPENIEKGWFDSLPPTQAGMDVGVWAEDSRFEYMREALENSHFPAPVIAGYWELLDIIWESSIQYLTGEKSVDQAMSEADTKVQKLLDENQNAIILGKK